MAHLRLPCVTDGYERSIRRRKDLSDARERFLSRHLAQLRPGRRTEAGQLSTPDPVNDQLQPKGGPMLARRRLPSPVPLTYAPRRLRECAVPAANGGNGVPAQDEEVELPAVSPLGE